MELHEIYQSDNNLYLVVDLIQYINLETWIDKFLQNEGSDDRIKQIIHQLLELECYLNSNNIIIGFLLPSDIFLNLKGNYINIIIGNYKSFIFSNYNEEMILNL